MWENGVVVVLHHVKLWEDNGVVILMLQFLFQIHVMKIYVV
jgi:hypothetical protein